MDNIILEACSNLGLNIPEISTILKNYDNSFLNKKWYDSLANNKPDYSIYSDILYIGEAFYCWKMYSKKNINLLNKTTKLMSLRVIDEIKQPDYIIDLGCGLGLTTLMLKKLFPNAKVIGTNISGTYQWDIANYISKLYDFSILETIPDIKGNIVIIALEYFEHFLKPIDELERVLTTKARYIICANTFNGKPSPGHFSSYSDSDIIYSGQNISRLFNKKLRDFGYISMKTGFWNNRPSVWKFKYL